MPQSACSTLYILSESRLWILKNKNLSITKVEWIHLTILPWFQSKAIYGQEFSSLISNSRKVRAILLRKKIRAEEKSLHLKIASVRAGGKYVYISKLFSLNLYQLPSISADSGRTVSFWI